MKRTYIYILLLSCIAFSACNDEWEDELFVNSVSFVNSGVVQVHVKYDEEHGIIPVKVPILLSGSTQNQKDITVSISLDKDTLDNLNFDRFRLREDLYFRELPSNFYEFESTTAIIPKGSNVGEFILNFKLDGIDLIDKYILPVVITETSDYGINNRKHYKRSLMHVVPFNDFSGRYSVAGEVWERDKPQSEQQALTVPYRNATVVDQNTVFFFAGVTEEEALDRNTYKIKAQFNEGDGTVTLTSDNPVINFSQQSGRYTVSKEMDEVLPYLERTYTTVDLEYEYDDITNPDFPLHYRYTGTMVLERTRNTLIPDEDQQSEIVIN